MMNIAVNWVALWARSFNKVGVVHKSDRNLVSKERLHPNGTMPLLGESDSGWTGSSPMLPFLLFFSLSNTHLHITLYHSYTHTQYVSEDIGRITRIKTHNFVYSVTVASFARLDIEIGGGACTAQLVTGLYFTWYVRAIWRELWQSQCGHDQRYCTVVCTVAYFTKQGREGLTSEWVDKRTSRPWARKVGSGCLSWRAGSSCRPWEREHTASECFSF